MSWNVMFCHGPAHGAASARSADASFVPVPHAVLHRVSFPSVLLSPPPAPRQGGTLFRAYRARLPARVAAGAVRAPDCPRARQGTGRRAHVSRAFHSGFSKPVPPAARRRGSGSGCRLSGSYIGIGLLRSRPFRELFQKKRTRDRFRVTPAGSAPFRGRQGCGRGPAGIRAAGPGRPRRPRRPPGGNLGGPLRPRPDAPATVAPTRTSTALWTACIAQSPSPPNAREPSTCPPSTKRCARRWKRECEGRRNDEGGSAKQGISVFQEAAFACVEVNRI